MKVMSVEAQLFLRFFLKSIRSIWIVLILAITGCGFQLRGMELKELPVIYLEGGTLGTGIRMNIERMLHTLGTRMVASREQAQIVLQLLNENYQRWPLSISSQLLVQEYQLIYTVEFQLANTAGQILLTPQSLTFTRDYSFSDTNQVLGKGNEETLLRQEMLDNASRQILSHIITNITNIANTNNANKF